MAPAVLPLANGGVSVVYPVDHSFGHAWHVVSPNSNFVGTVRLEGTIDGTHWLPIAIDLDGNTDLAAGVFAFVNGLRCFTSIRWRLTAYTSGTLAIYFAGLTPALVQG